MSQKLLDIASDSWACHCWARCDVYVLVLNLVRLCFYYSVTAWLEHGWWWLLLYIQYTENVNHAIS